tara:strand:- start:6649 stop:7011 length:363 start_codon:yes stop_codon:yes gene_type:complete
MGFKLGSENRKIRTPENTDIFRKKLEEGVLAQANNNGTVDIDTSVEPGSPLEKRVVNHELQHMNDMESGRASYGENWVMWEGKMYFRKTIEGEKVIDGPSGRLPEGHPDHPWEQAAVEAE